MSELLKADETARWLGVHTVTLAAWRSRGEGPPWIKLGARSVRYRAYDIEKWLRANEQVTTRTAR